MEKKGIILTSLSAILLGIIPLITHILFTYNLDVVEISFYRYALIVPILFILCKWKKVALRISKQEAWSMLVSLSLFSTLTMLLLNSSYQYINTGIATTLHFLYPFLVVLLCKLFYKDRIDNKTKKAMLLMMVGILCFFLNAKIDHITGILFALLSSVTYAIYLVEMEKKGLSKLHPFVFSFYISLYTSIMLFLVQVCFSRTIIPISIPIFGWLCVLSIISLLALMTLQLGSKYIGAKLTSMFSLFEPITSIIIGVVILQEDFTVWKLLGCVLIFIAVMYLALGKKKNGGRIVNNELRLHANEIRKNIIKMVFTAQSGHIGGSLSAVEIMTYLYFEEMDIDINNVKETKRNRFVLSKGHASPLLYALLAQKGLLKKSELSTFRRIDSTLQGHPNMNYVDGVDMSTGSLGQGISAAVGMALANKIDNNEYRVYALLGDGECEEGEVWEAAMAAAHYKLNNLCAIVDHNGLQIDGDIRKVLNPTPIDEKFSAFGWNCLIVDGHDFDALKDAFNKAKLCLDKPTMILAHTTKGKGVSFMENQVQWHGSAPNEKQYLQAIKELEDAYE